MQYDPKRLTRMAEALQTQAIDSSPVQHPFQALARVMAGYQSGKLRGRVREAEAGQSAAFGNVMQQIGKGTFGGDISKLSPEDQRTVAAMNAQTGIASRAAKLAQSYAVALKASPDGKGPTTTPVMKNAIALGLKPGTTEYSDYIRNATKKGGVTVNVGGGLDKGYELVENPTGEGTTARAIPGASKDPAVIAKIEETKAVAKARAGAKIDLPKAKHAAKFLRKALDGLVTGTFGEDGKVVVTSIHPGLSDVVGAPGLAALPMVAGFDPVGGTDASNFHVAHKQVAGKAFLQAFESLKGGGTITEAEGQKAEAALAKLSTDQTEEEYIKSVLEFRAEVDALEKLAEERAGSSAVAAPEPTSDDPLGLL